MRTVLIEESTQQAQQLLNFIETLPFVTIPGENKKSIREAIVKYNAVSLDTFIDELKASVKEHFEHA